LVKSSIAITFLTVSKASAQSNKTIGVVTTIKLKRPDEEWQCFVAGLNADGWYETGGGAKHVILHDPTGAGGNYGGSFNTNFLRGLIAGHGGVDLIGVVGGVISRVAASQQLTNIPYVYLSGMAPSNAPHVHPPSCRPRSRANTLALFSIFPRYMLPRELPYRAATLKTFGSFKTIIRG
jgi:hypothetical protein